MVICKVCDEERIVLRDGECFICIRAKGDVPGTEIKNQVFNRRGGTEVESKTGSIKRGAADNSWMDTKNYW